MALSWEVYSFIIHDGLDADRVKKMATLRRLHKEGVSKRDAIHHVLFPHKTVEQFDAMCEEYDSVFKE